MQYPSSTPGEDVFGIKDKNVEVLYQEARNSLGAGAYTASVMICRKILMHVAVVSGASENLTFIEYVNFLETNHWIPPNGKVWVDHIRDRGNIANHEIKISSKTEATQLLRFTEMLLRLVFEFPALAETK